MERRIMFVQGELFSDVLFPIAHAESSSGTLIDTDFGKNMWVPIDEAIKNEEKDSFDCIDLIAKVLRMIQDGSVQDTPFVYQEVIKKGDKRP